MQSATSHDPRYPVGKFSYVPAQDAATRKQRIDLIAALPEQVRAAVGSLSEADLEKTYREGGWTIRQLVHHVADSHMNAYIRFKLALTEHEPTIKPYKEAEWAQLADSKLPITPSVQMLDALHVRWVALMRSLTDADWQRALVHPDLGPMTLDKVLGLYDWHSRHHLAHIHQALAAR